jgi:peptidyl-prolyl cis-trans isomerase D
VLNLRVERVTAVEGQPLVSSMGMLPGATAWAFTGSQVGEISSLFDSDNAYFLARLDSLTRGGVAPFNEVREEIRMELLRRKKVEAMKPRALAFAQEAAKSSLDAAAQAQGLTVERTEMFTRGGFAGSLGRLNQAIGAAFSLPLGRISEPIGTDDAVVVLRVDRRVTASREAFDSVKAERRQQAIAALREQRVRAFFDALRSTADVDDNRDELAAAARRQVG